ncbi:hypothetical protein APZ24_gp157 [Ostreococcus lucimarinus virus 2]|jgi:hypothetical protein|uniref:hypothetical protein n=1 Tax=Ostreococcus lucimarinus virus OlV5 TaxID=754064 RepID=UPI00026335A8|nr:hypothetical protein OLNG_00100 [Ostreococcus lucimarinus virus OlV5]YP_009172648.1 hypothetical protein APZ24_gp157 [Ostreococcus lucimarinus virus 2]AFK65851.1 hypothetical protein OLVG_00097 [Ostreococcus lucimarinus virus OlV6]AGH31173.1 hypothetical protein OLNG_00100 [Ostreococcus lucimarinus virus OlV5]ALI95520.1 hypothetical protein OlV2_157 [Ostreococcus lucimarinus virus 2]
MIVPSEINENDIVKLLVNEDDIEDDFLAVVGMNTGLVLGVRYLNPTELIYKSACVYQLEDGDMNPAPYESVMEHYPSGTTFEDLEFKMIKDGLYANLNEIDIEDSDSEIYDEDESDSEMDDFIVPDNEIDGKVIPPSDYKAIDKEWNAWEPRSPGARSFKETVDAIEAMAKAHADNLSFGA